MYPHPARGHAQSQTQKQSLMSPLYRQDALDRQYPLHKLCLLDTDIQPENKYIQFQIVTKLLAPHYLWMTNMKARWTVARKTHY